MLAAVGKGPECDSQFSLGSVPGLERTEAGRLLSPGIEVDVLAPGACGGAKGACVCSARIWAVGGGREVLPGGSRTPPCSADGGRTGMVRGSGGTGLAGGGCMRSKLTAVCAGCAGLECSSGSLSMPTTLLGLASWESSSMQSTRKMKANKHMSGFKPPHKVFHQDPVRSCASF